MKKILYALGVYTFCTMIERLIMNFSRNMDTMEEIARKVSTIKYVIDNPKDYGKEEKVKRIRNKIGF